MLGTKIFPPTLELDRDSVIATFEDASGTYRCGAAVIAGLPYHEQAQPTEPNLSDFGLIAITVPCTAPGGPGDNFAMNPDGDMLSSGKITVTLDESLGINFGGGIQMGGVRNGTSWPVNFTINGRTLSFNVLMRSDSPSYPYMVGIIASFTKAS